MNRRGFLSGLMNTAVALPVLKFVPPEVIKPITSITDTSVGYGYDPVLISLVRNCYPIILAHEICGVQKMTGPTGLQFAIKSTYKETK